MNDYFVLVLSFFLGSHFLVSGLSKLYDFSSLAKTIASLDVRLHPLISPTTVPLLVLGILTRESGDVVGSLLFVFLIAINSIQ